MEKKIKKDENNLEKSVLLTMQLLEDKKGKVTDEEIKAIADEFEVDFDELKNIVVNTLNDMIQ